MSSDDSLAIIKAISDFRQEASEAIGTLHAEFSGFKGNIEARMVAVEEDQKKSERRQWVHSCIVLAGSVLHHDLGKWLNLKF
jgi:hypothetical protein